MKFYSKKNLHFLLNDVFQIESLSQYPFFKDHNIETYTMVLDACTDLSTQKLRPILTEMDRNAPEFTDGRIKVHPAMKELMQAFGSGGWINSPLSYEEGGQQMPYMIFNATLFIMGAANYSATVYPFLSAGAANLIRSFGTPIQKATYLEKMYNGTWQGTMALTEPEAGSSLGDITTSAEPTDHGYYKIKGQKIFISCGDHDGVENIVHLMLARIKGAPKGSKGISLFIVPRMRPDADGHLEFNDVTTGGIFHKMGYKGAPIAHIITGEQDDCRGYLVGEANKGLFCMFQMMNEARIAVGFNAASIASAAYYAALQYCRERSQGRRIGSKSTQQSLIIEHADVKRMLLFQRSVVEGSLSLLMECSRYADLVRVTKGEEQQKYDALLGLLTPVAKSYPSEMGCLSTSAAIQCLGGYGFTEDFLPEHFYREARIHPIHEGTTAIHGMDLLGRKIAKDQGATLRLLIAEVTTTIEKAFAVESLQKYANDLKTTLEKLVDTTMNLSMLGMQGQLEAFLSDATLYLETFGTVVIGWQWLKQGLVATQKLDANEDAFYQGKLYTMEYFFEYELPKTRGLLKTLKSQTSVTVDIQDGHFD
ncbi:MULTISPECIES: acyl-CoA dehydrogenase [unclassified Aureispira]|uniref:acyl-CoA dehydrogenase n=1 Tax=unclassified Aureispira TaxID=2649989 RepID=UPI0006989975|nr:MULTISPECIES: acyl-CoA dehydrogenase [unclassified Aureispira]WMX16248.1 acyl-CoA dehydrogenase [Aureispira sp. CCB-E]